MNKQEDKDHFLNQFFREQRQGEVASSPSFAESFGKAQQKRNKMKNVKITLVIAMALLLLAVVAVLTRDREKANAPIQVAAAGLRYYEALKNEGKFVVYDIRFAYDRADLRPESMPIIQTIAEMMEADPKINLSIEGHTDAQGSSSYNQKLSAARAAAVRQALLDRGIDAARLRAAGFGESQPVADNSSDSGRAKNRRVEFVGF